MFEKDTPFVASANLRWQHNQPSSTDYGDRYFDDVDGLAESRYTYIEGADVHSQWQRAITEKRPSTTVMELGFGSGLNFLATLKCWRLWRQQMSADQHRANHVPVRLRYFSIESQPMRPDDMRRALSRWSNELPDIEKLVAQMPPFIRGQHRLHFDNRRVELVLLIDDVRTALQELVANQAFIDATYLDGFSPASNAAMWDHGVLQRLAELSRPHATLATFTAAGNIRRSLQRVGFEVNRHPGFGRKREMLRAVKKRSPPLRKIRDRNPWIAWPFTQTPKRVAIIGAGLAGVTSARALAERGVHCTLFEREPDIAQRASAVPAAGWFPQLSRDFDPRSEILWQACRMLESLLLRLEQEDNAGVDWCDRRGCFFVADTPERETRMRATADSLAGVGVPVKFVSSAETAEHTGLDLRYPGLDCALGGSIIPAQLCRVLLRHDNIETRFESTANPIQCESGRWRIKVDSKNGNDNACSNEYDAVVLATGADTRIAALTLPEQYDLNHGHVSLIEGTADTGQKRLLCFKGYLTSALGVNGIRVTGATVNRDDIIGSTDQFTGGDENLMRLNRILPQTDLNSTTQHSLADYGHADSHQQWRGQRLSSRDRLPLLGPVPDRESLVRALVAHQKSSAMRDFQAVDYKHGLFVNLAHGGRGASTALLCAQLLAEIMTGTPLCLPKRLASALHPARFLVRDTLTMADVGQGDV